MTIILKMAMDTKCTIEFNLRLNAERLVRKKILITQLIVIFDKTTFLMRHTSFVKIFLSIFHQEIIHNNENSSTELSNDP